MGPRIDVRMVKREEESSAGSCGGVELISKDHSAAILVRQHDSESNIMMLIQSLAYVNH